MVEIVEKKVDDITYYGYYNSNNNFIYHREDGPAAIIWEDGSQIWCFNGEIHREDGPAVIYPDGRQMWFINDKTHREDGPAEIWEDGSQIWCFNDERHREDGPAVIYPDGTQEWFINNIFVTDKVSSWLYERNIDPDNMTEEDKFSLTFFMRSLV